MCEQRPPMETRTELYDSTGQAAYAHIQVMEEAGWSVRQLAARPYMVWVVYERERPL